MGKGYEKENYETKPIKTPTVELYSDGRKGQRLSGRRELNDQKFGGPMQPALWRPSVSTLLTAVKMMRAK